jgi:S-formylglutathione hydrolase
MPIERTARNRCFGGWVESYKHASRATGTEMRFSVFLPHEAEKAKVPVLYFLSGLTCTDENFTTKAGAQRYAAEAGIALVAPDTSPRGPGVAEGDSWDLGLGAGFYVDATEAPWSTHYKMYTYVTDELPTLVREALPTRGDREGVTGHSMGGHGALVVSLRQPGRYRSVSALAPICAPTQCPWGEKAFSNYLGSDRANWSSYDAVALLEKAESAPELLVDQGEDDKFLANQLKPELLEAVCKRRGFALKLRRHARYDHSYYFIATVIGDHVAHHASRLRG